MASGTGIRTFRFSGFVGGVNAAANIFDQPVGTVLRASNLVGTRRGGLQTVDGSHVVSSPASGTSISPIVFLGRYNPKLGVGASRLFAVMLSNGTASIYDANGSTYGPTPLGSYPNAGPLIGGVQFSNSFFFALGLNSPIYVYQGSSGQISQLANAYQATTNYPPWLPSVAYPKGAHVYATSGGTNYIFRAKHGGRSGKTAPAWPATLNARVNDQEIIWINKGPLNNGGPTGAAFLFNHMNSLWVWGTAATYDSTGVNGPDSLWMSDEGQPSWFDPSNQAFIGQGDGQMPMGGAVWTQLEVGIPANPQLVLFKSLSTYSVVGSFPAISIQAIPNGAGCVAPNTIQLVPGIGMMRLSAYGVAVFTGTTDVVESFTDPLRPYLFGGASDIAPLDWANVANSTALQTVNPPGYLLLVPTVGSNGLLNRGFFFDRMLKAWFVIDFPFPLSAALMDIANPGAAASLVAGAHDGVIRQIFAGDEFWDAQPTTPIAWSVRTPVVGAPTTPIFIRRILTRIRATGTGPALVSAAMAYEQGRGGGQESTGLTLAIDTNGMTQAIDVGRTTLGGAYFDIFGSGRMVLEGLEYQYVSKPVTRVPG
jgi:hypothetical protein